MGRFYAVSLGFIGEVKIWKVLALGKSGTSMNPQFRPRQRTRAKNRPPGGGGVEVPRPRAPMPRHCVLCCGMALHWLNRAKRYPTSHPTLPTIKIACCERDHVTVIGYWFNTNAASFVKMVSTVSATQIQMLIFMLSIVPCSGARFLAAPVQLRFLRASLVME